MDNISLFYDQKDENGISNREKITSRQKIIRRTDDTDKNKSYEESAGQSDGIVLENGRLIGFGIHIFNKDIYPIQSFEIYLRGCDLTGTLDLSGQKELLFVDVYHNRISDVLLNGDASLRILGLQDNQISRLDVKDLTACQGIDVGKNQLTDLDVSQNQELAELYVDENRIESIDLTHCPKLMYFNCQNNRMRELDTRKNPFLRHLSAIGNPMKAILSLAPQREDALPLELTAGEGGCVGLRFNPVYNAQWKETGEWQQTYYAYPDEGYQFIGWYDPEGNLLSRSLQWMDEYGSSRILHAVFEPRGNEEDFTIQYYDDHAEEYKANTIGVDMGDIRSRFLAHLPEGARILDFGCGTGRDTKAFRDLGYEAAALDGSEKLCRIAEDYTGIPVKCMDFRDYSPAEGEYYDGIWACASLLHLKRAELIPVMRNLGAALKEGGALYLSFKYGDSEGERNGRYFTDFTLEGIWEFMKMLPEFSILEYWLSRDVRPGRGDEKWLNMILERK